MTLSSNTAVRRGSTPLPIKHQLRREEAVYDDCDWTTGAAGPSASPVSFSPALDDTLTVSFEGRHDGPLRITLLGQNGVGKSSLALALAGDMDRAVSVDSEGTKPDSELCKPACKGVPAPISHLTPNCCFSCPQRGATCAQSLWMTRRAPSLSMTTGDRWAKQHCSLLPH